MADTQKSMEWKGALGKSLRRLRGLAGLTQEDLARKAGLTRVSIAAIERGAANPSLTALSQIAEALGYQIADLFSPGLKRQNAYIMQPFGGNLYEPLAEQLTSVQNGALHIQVAYAKSSGVDLLTSPLRRFKERGGRVSALVGIDQRNTTAEALYKLLQLCDELCVIHDTAFAQTYHPKVYLVSSPGRAWAAVGSNNLTRGGLCKHAI